MESQSQNPEFRINPCTLLEACVIKPVTCGKEEKNVAIISNVDSLPISNS